MAMLSLRIPQELRDELDGAADALDRSVGYLVRTAIREWLERKAAAIEVGQMDKRLRS